MAGFRPRQAFSSGPEWQERGGCDHDLVERVPQDDFRAAVGTLRGESYRLCPLMLQNERCVCFLPCVPTFSAAR